MRTRLIVTIIVVLFIDILLSLPGAVAASGQKTDAISVEDYALSYVPTAPERDSSCGFAVKDEAEHCLTQKSLGPFRFGENQKKGRCLRPDGLGL